MIKLNKNKGQKLHDAEIGSEFLVIAPRQQVLERKIVQIKNFCIKSKLLMRYHFIPGQNGWDSKVQLNKC